MEDTLHSKEESLPEYKLLGFKELYRKYYEALVLYAYQIMSDSAIAEDIVQEVFTRTWENDVSIESETAIHIYLYNAVRNRSLKYLRHLQVEHSYMKKVISENPIYNVDGSDEKLLMTESIYDSIFDCIDQLPKQQKQVVLLMLDGKKLGEMSKILHLSESSVKTHRRRALSFLKTKLNKNEYIIFLSLIF